MDIKQVAKLAEISYSENKLDETRVNRIIKHLSKNELREYLKALKRLEKKHYVIIEFAYELSEQDKNKFEKLYPDKKIIFAKNSELLLGIRITEDDKVYNLNMKRALEQVSSYISRSI